MWLQLIELFLAAIVLYALYFRWTRRKLFASVREMSGPLNLPIIGIGHVFAGKVTPEAVGRKLRYILDGYPPPVYGWLGPYLMVVLSTPEHCKIVLNSAVCLNKSFLYKFFDVKALLTTEGTRWKPRRKMLNLSFTPGLLNNFFGVFNQKARQFVNDSRNLADGVERNMFKVFAGWTLENICATVLDFDVNEHFDKDEYLRKVEVYLPLVSKRTFKVHHYLDFIYHRSKDCAEFNEARKSVRKVTEEVMERRFVKNKRTQYSEAVAGNNEITTRAKALLDMLCDMVRDKSQDMTMDEMADHMDEIIYAGFDTTATTVSNVVLMLAMHPEIQERVYQEVMTVCPDVNTDISQENGNELVYTDMVIKETLRLYPVVALFGRCMTADLKLDDRFTLITGTHVIISLRNLHRNPEIWGPQAETFNPDNFLPERVAKRHPYSFLPFSGGPRNCIGARYAMLSMRLFVAYFVRAFQVRTSLREEDIETTFEILQRITNGCVVSLHAR